MQPGRVLSTKLAPGVYWKLQLPFERITPERLLAADNILPIQTIVPRIISCYQRQLLFITNDNHVYNAPMLRVLFIKLAILKPIG